VHVFNRKLNGARHERILHIGSGYMESSRVSTIMRMDVGHDFAEKRV